MAYTLSTNLNSNKLIISQKCKFKSVKDIFKLSDNKPIVIAGPCSIENYNRLDKIANLLKEVGVKCIRGGAYKPRTSPYDFQGLGEDGLKILNEVAEKYGLLAITEVVDTRHVELVSKYVSILQIGSRNMDNYELLKEVGNAKNTVMLKRGFSATINEFMLAAEYIAKNGKNNIILCERGIRTFETKTRNTLDISCIPIIKLETNLPIIVDLSHSLGRKDIVYPIAKAVIAVGGDGIMIEVHPDPNSALSDNEQQMNVSEFKEFMDKFENGFLRC